VQEVLADNEEYVPAEQDVHEPSPDDALYLPAAQLVHAVAVDAE